jgi:hypothetical protein
MQIHPTLAHQLSVARERDAMAAGAAGRRARRARRHAHVAPAPAVAVRRPGCPEAVPA